MSENIQITENARRREFPAKLRSLALVAACVSGLALTVAGGAVVLPFPFMVLLGVGIDRWAPFVGRLLVLVGATLASVWVFLFVAPPSFFGLLTIGSYHNLNAIGFILLGLAAVALTVWLDAELIIDDRRSRRDRSRALG